MEKNYTPLSIKFNWHKKGPFGGGIIGFKISYIRVYIKKFIFPLIYIEFTWHRDKPIKIIFKSSGIFSYQITMEIQVKTSFCVTDKRHQNMIFHSRMLFHLCLYWDGWIFFMRLRKISQGIHKRITMLHVERIKVFHKYHVCLLYKII